jgi:hypothetical protein
MPTLSSRCDEPIVQACPPHQWVELLDSLRREADDLEKLKATVDGAALIRRITEEVESLLTSVTVGQKEAAKLSGYSPRPHPATGAPGRDPELGDPPRAAVPGDDASGEGYSRPLPPAQRPARLELRRP